LGDRRVIKKDLRLRLWTPRQWKRRLRDAGLALVRLYAGLEGTPYRATASRLVVLAERR
jgi:hypothetical protein